MIEEALKSGVRIIPAFAGNTMYKMKSRGKYWDHPRIRGEHISSEIDNPAGRGSSPHSRGTLTIIIKANRHRKDHPRIRGEHM